MTVIPERKDYKNCVPSLAEKFCAEVEKRNICKRISITKADEKSHFDRYGFSCKNKKVSVVYDTKANILSVTAPEEVSIKLFDLYNELTAPKQQKKQPVPVKKQEPKKVKQDGKSSKQEPKFPVKKETKKAETEENATDFSLKKFTAGRFDEVINKLKKDKKRYKVEQEGVFDKGKPTELISYVVKSNDKKLKLRFMPKKQIVQLQGKHGQTFSELQILISEETDYKTAVVAHIEQSKEDKKATDVERQLKKLIPHAFKYLSEQSKIDFTIGVIEVLNNNNKHYDYSMLLMSPFRGLERLIFDIQKAQNIVVKMIGQAYEKENGKHILKASYRRKINSIVYTEVVSALYGLYFETRNYYTHTDSDGAEGRMITTREEVKSIFTRILEVVDYNCKKLSEIGFSV